MSCNVSSDQADLRPELMDTDSQRRVDVEIGDPVVPVALPRCGDAPLDILQKSELLRPRVAKRLNVAPSLFEIAQLVKEIHFGDVGKALGSNRGSVREPALQLLEAFRRHVVDATLRASRRFPYLAVEKALLF